MARLLSDAHTDVLKTTSSGDHLKDLLAYLHFDTHSIHLGCYILDVTFPSLVQ